MKKKRAMDEKSQIEAMRAALRGDLERARERRGSTLLQPAGPPEPEPEAPEAEAEVELQPEPEPEPELGPVAEEPEHLVEAEPEIEREPVAQEPEPQAVEVPPERKRRFRFWRR